MLELVPTTQFRRDYKLMKRRGYDMALLESIINTLLEEKSLDARHHDHALAGRYTGLRECHIRPDWLLIYAIDREMLTLTASRTGTHSDLLDR